MLLRHAKELGYKNTRIFVDDGVSGTTFDRAGWQELIAEVDVGNVIAILIKDMSRMGRDYLRVGLYMEQFAEQGIRLVAIGDAVDTNNGTDDFTPFRNIMAEWYARDISKKIKAAFRNKALSGKSLSAYPLYGYKVNPSNKHQWVVDDEAAKIVQEIYKLCMEGHGASRIGAILDERGVDPPSVYNEKNNITSKARLTYWSRDTIENILSRIEYLGHTVSYRYYSKSYKSKQSSKNERDKWVVTENTHQPILDERLWERVQKLRESTKRKVTRMGEMGVLNGLLYCFDCGRRLRIQRNTGSEFNYYVCPTYSTSLAKPRECSTHSTPRHVIEPLILSELQRFTKFAREHESEFIALVEKNYERVSEKELRSAKAELTKAEKRVAELDRIIKKLYEDNAMERIADDWFEKMFAEYTSEQSGLEVVIKQISEKVETENESRRNIERFLELVKSYTDISELTAEIVRIFIDRIVCHQSNGRMNANRRQQIDIYYNFIGLVDILNEK